MHAYENEGKGWDQNVNNAPKDNEGQTVGAWSITQKSNFNVLSQYMAKENIDAEYVSAFSAAHGSSNGSMNVHPDRKNGKSKSISKYIDELVKPQYKDTDNYKKFIVATTKMFAESWWKATLIAINKSGVKTRLGRTTIIVMMVHTGGNIKAYSESLFKGKFYNRIKDKSKIDEIARLEPYIAGADKEKDWLYAFWKNFKNDIHIAQDFIAKLDSNDLDPTTFEMQNHKNSTVRLGGGLPSDMASETNIVLPLLKAVGSPAIGNTYLDEMSNAEVAACDVFIDPGHTKRALGSSSDRELAGKFKPLLPGGALAWIGKKFNIDGNRANEPLEHILNAFIGGLVNAKLKSAGIKVFYYDEDIKSRDELNNVIALEKSLKPGSVFLSIHNNADNDDSPNNNFNMLGGASGTDIYFNTGSRSSMLANMISNNIHNNLSRKSSVHTANSYGVLNHIPSSAAGVLIECAYYDNATDCAWLVQNAEQFANSISQAVIAHLKTN